MVGTSIEDDSTSPKLLVKSAACFGEALTRIPRTPKDKASAQLSAILDGAVPLVELETDRLMDAMSWLYDSVKSLQQQGLAHSTDIKCLGDTLQQWKAVGSGADAWEPGSLHQSDATEAGSSITGAEGLATGMQDLAEHRPDSPDSQGPMGAFEQRIWRVQKDLRKALVQQDQRRIADEKLLEIRLQSMTRDLERKLERNDLEELNKTLSEKFQAFERKAREDVGLVGSMLHGDSASDRRRLQTQFEMLSTRVSAQIELVEKELRANVERRTEMLQSMDARLIALEGLSVTLSDDQASSGQALEARVRQLENFEENLPPPEQLKQNAQTIEELVDRMNQLGGGDLCPVGLSSEKAVETLETSPSERRGVNSRSVDLDAGSANQGAQNLFSTQQEEEVESAAAAVSVRTLSRDLPDTGGISEGDWQSQVERRIAQLEAVGSSGDIHSQLVEVHRTSTDFHHKCLELDRRLSCLETAGEVAPRVQTPATPTATWRSAFDSRVADLEHVLNDAAVAQQEATDKLRRASEQQAAEAASLHQTLENLEVLICGAASNECGEGGGPATAGSHGDRGDALAWLDKRVKLLIQQRHGLSIEARLRALESIDHDPELADRVAELDRAMRKLNVDELRKVRPCLQEYRHEQVVFEEDLRRDMQELKVLVGCLEACIPRETKKAVDLFKRAAGANEAVPLTHQELEMEGKILELREDVEKRLGSAEETVTDQCDRVSQVVRSLEKKQQVLEERLDHFLGGPPASASRRSSSAGTQAHSRLSTPISDKLVSSSGADAAPGSSGKNVQEVASHPPSTSPQPQVIITPPTSSPPAQDPRDSPLPDGANLQPSRGQPPRAPPKGWEKRKPSRS